MSVADDGRNRRDGRAAADAGAGVNQAAGLPVQPQRLFR